jgi:hypothetical protein
VQRIALKPIQSSSLKITSGPSGSQRSPYAPECTWVLHCRIASSVGEGIDRRPTVSMISTSPVRSAAI